MKPILTYTCDEPEGKITRHVYPLIFTAENIQKLWERSHQFPTLFGREVGSIQEFYNLYIDPESNQLLSGGLFWVIDDFVGIFYLTDISDMEATVHYSFFDQRHRGRGGLARAMIKYVLSEYKFHRLNAFVPLYTSRYVRHFIASLGFILEGRKRQAAMFKGDWYDVMFYGMLYTDVYPPAEKA